MSRARRAKRQPLITREEWRWLLLTVLAAFIGGLAGILVGDALA
jgi:hypothetical protein